MRKSILFILTVFISLTAMAQAQLKTKQYVVSDFKQKTMKVVLTGNEMTDAGFRESMQTVWNISPYEFCSEAEFESSKTSADYYFLVLADSGKEAADEVKILGIYKGKAGAKDIEGLYKVVSIPFCSAENADGQELVFLPALLSILQTQVQSIMERKINISESVMVDFDIMARKWQQRCAIAEKDFAEDPGISMAAIYAGENIDVVDPGDIEKYITERTDGVLVGYCVAPSEPKSGTYCYTMLIDASTWELYYFKKRKISESLPAGFTPKEASAIISHQPKK